MVSKYDEFRSSRRTPLLIDSTNALSVGFPGREKSSPILFQNAHIEWLGDEFRSVVASQNVWNSALSASASTYGHDVVEQNRGATSSAKHSLE
jgi:hypothetical protein